MQRAIFFVSLVALVSASKAVFDHAPPAPGSDEMKAEFALAKTYKNFNHGSFGSPPHAVLKAQQGYRDECEARPDRWFRGGYEGYLRATRLEMGKYLNNDEGKDLVFVENASTGVNAVLRSLNLGPDDVILYLSTAYGMVKNTADYLRQMFGVEILEIPVRFPGNGTAPTDVHGRSIVEAVQAAISSSNRHISLGVFSHIASVPAWILPIEEIARVCNRSGIPVLVDGAHALGQIPVDLKALNAAGVTYWVGNGHKWLYSPKGSAVFYVAPWAQPAVIPPVISSAYVSGIVDDHSNFLNHFQYVGTKDYTPVVTIHDAIAFRNWVGEAEILTYNHDLAVWAQDRLAEIWNTETLLPADQIGFMGHTRFPVTTADQMYKIDGLLFSMFDTEVTTFPLLDPVSNQTTFWIRLSAQLYLNQGDFEEMAFRVLDLKDKMEKGEL